MADISQVKLPNNTTYDLSVKAEKIKSGYLENRIYLNTHPENSGSAVLPFLYNDLAFLTKRGGSIDAYLTTATTYTAATLSNRTEYAINSPESMFDGSPSYANNIARTGTSATDIRVIDLTLHKIFPYSNIFYIDFGAVAWKATKITVLVKNADTETNYVKKLETTNNTLGHWYGSVSHSSTNTSGTTVQGFDRMRIVISGFDDGRPTGNTRIAQIGLINYGSFGAKETFISRGGCAGIFGDLIPYTNNNISLGSSSKNWANGYFTNIHGELDGNASSSSGNIAIELTNEDADTLVPENTTKHYVLNGNNTVTNLPQTGKAGRLFVYKNSSNDGGAIGTQIYTCNDGRIYTRIYGGPTTGWYPWYLNLKDCYTIDGTKITGNKFDGTNVNLTRYGTCSTAAATAAKIATVGSGSGFYLVTGAIVYIKFTNSNTVANPTLNVNSTGAKPIMRYGTTTASTNTNTSWYAGSVVSFVYDGTNWVMNSFSHRGNENTYDRTYIGSGFVQAKSAIVAANIIVAGSDGLYFHLKTGSAFNITKPIFYANSAIAANATGNNNYLIIPFTITTTQSITLTDNKPVFIKGTLSGTTFTPISTTPLTQTIPTTEDGYQYMLLGAAYSTTAMYLLPDHSIYEYRNGKFRLYTPTSGSYDSSTETLTINL